MAFNKTKDLCVVVAKYTDKNGKNKNVYENIGHISTDETGAEMMHLKASVVPFALRDPKYATVVVSRFDVKPASGDATATPAPQPAVQSQGLPDEGFSDDIPF